MIGALIMAVGLCTTQIAGFNTCRSGIPNVWAKQVSSPLPEVSVTATITLSRKTSVAIARLKVIHRHGPWRSFEAVEFATLEWVDHRHLLEPIGNIPQPKPKRTTTFLSTRQLSPHNSNQVAFGKPCAVHLAG